jgi:ribosomal protein S4E
LKFDIGASVFIMKGKKVGMQGKLLEIRPHKGKRGSNIIVQVGEEKVETAKDYAFVVGDVELKNE